MPSVAAASSLSQAQVQTEVAFAVARKSLDNMKAQGDAALSLLQAAADIQQVAQQQPAQRPLEPGQTINVVA
ncbi:MAG: YjfB family protein [Phycisphaeraceae bacterium]